MVIEKLLKLSAQIGRKNDPYNDGKASKERNPANGVEREYNTFSDNSNHSSNEEKRPAVNSGGVASVSSDQSIQSSKPLA